jgi:hypothetical protein
MKLAITGLLLLSASALGQSDHLGITLPGLSGAPEHRIQVAKQLGGKWYRPDPVFLAGDAKCDDCEAARAAGLNIDLVVRNGAPGKPSTAVTNADDFKNKLRAVLGREKPAMLVVEDEPEDAHNFSGTPDDYRAELTAACEVSRSLKIPCANGGLSSVATANLVIDQRFPSDQIDAANIALSTELIRVKTGKGLNVNIFNKSVGHDKDVQEAVVKATQQYLDKQKPGIDRTRQFLVAINGVHVDRLNFHWYELQPDNVPRVLDSLHQLSKLDLMCDGMGEKQERGFEVDEKLRQAITNYVWPTIWAGTDGREGSVGLVDKKGKLRPNASAFQQLARTE